MNAAEHEFIFETAPFASCHASTLVETKAGEWLAAWFGGSAEGNSDCAIWSARRSRNGKWTAPAAFIREPGIQSYNPVLFYSADRVLWAYYKFGHHPERWTAGRRFSRDEGATWSPVEHLPAGLVGPVRTKPYVARDGAILAGTSVESYRAWACWVERSADNGATWTKHGPITVPRDFAAVRQAALDKVPVPGFEQWGDTWGIIQPSIVPLGAGKLRIYARATPKIGRVCVSDSTDGGRTWTPARPIDVPNPNTGLDAVALKDGRIVLVYNHSATGRSPLNLAVSRDGDRFNMFLTLESAPGGEFSYPAMVQGADGDLYVTYTWKRTRIRFVRIPLKEIPQ